MSKSSKCEVLEISIRNKNSKNTLDYIIVIVNSDESVIKVSEKTNNILYYSILEIEEIIINPPFFNKRFVEIDEISKIDHENKKHKDVLMFIALIMNYNSSSQTLYQLRAKAYISLIECLFWVNDEEYLSFEKIIEWILNEIIILSIFSNELTKDYDSFVKEIYLSAKKAIRKMIKKDILSETENMFRMKKKKILTVQVPNNIHGKHIRDYIHESIFIMISKQYKNIGLKGSYSYKYFTRNIERKIFDLDFVLTSGNQDEKIKTANKLLRNYSHRDIIFTIRDNVFQSSCIFVKTNLSDKLHKVYIEILCNSLVKSNNDFVTVKPMYVDESFDSLKVTSIEISFASKLGALSSFFRKDDSFHEKKMSSLYDINILLCNSNIKEMIYKEKLFKKYILDKIIEDYDVQTQYGEYFTYKDIFIDNIDLKIYSLYSIKCLENYIDQNKFRLLVHNKEFQEFLKYYYKLLREVLADFIESLPLEK